MCFCWHFSKKNIFDNLGTLCLGKQQHVCYPLSAQRVTVLEKATDSILQLYKDLKYGKYMPQKVSRPTVHFFFFLAKSFEIKLEKREENGNFCI